MLDQHLKNVWVVLTFCSDSLNFRYKIISKWFISSNTDKNNNMIKSVGFKTYLYGKHVFNCINNDKNLYLFYRKYRRGAILGSINKLAIKVIL